MSNRSGRTCLHPHCAFEVKRGRFCCGRHWFTLPAELQQKLTRAKEVEVLGALKIEAIEYFRSRMIGNHEIVRCRGEDCGTDIVWMLTRRGRNIPVDRAGVSADDDLYDAKKHSPHWASCPNERDFRNRGGGQHA